MDVDTIRLGEDFVKTIREKVAACQVLLAVIGPTWLRVSDDHNRPRLQNPGDYVRIEIAQALSAGIRVIPVLVGRATMPRARELPDDLLALANLHAFEIHDALFSDSLKQLLKELGPPVAPWPLSKRQTAVLALSVLFIIIAFALVNSPPSSRPPGTKPTPDEIEAQRKEPGLDQLIKKPDLPAVLRAPKLAELPPVVEEARSILLPPGTHSVLGPLHPKVLWSSYVGLDIIGIASNGTIFGWATSELSCLNGVRNGKELWAVGWQYVSIDWHLKGFDEAGRVWLDSNSYEKSYCFNSRGEGGLVNRSLPKNLARVGLYSDPSAAIYKCESGQVVRQKAPKWQSDIDGNCASWDVTEDAKGTIYAASDRGTLYALSPDGKVRWTYSLGFAPPAPRFIGDDVLIGAKDGLYRIHNGALKWKFPYAHEVDSSRIYDREETVYVHSYDRLMAISSTGKKLWELKTGTWPYENTGHPYALDNQGRLYITVNGGVICLGDK